MIEVKRDNLKISIKGHAGYDEIGKDIVCAGVSTLLHTYAFALDIEELQQDGEWLYVEPPNNIKALHICQAIWRGLIMISATYPDYVKLV